MGPKIVVASLCLARILNRGLFFPSLSRDRALALFAFLFFVFRSRQSRTDPGRLFLLSAQRSSSPCAADVVACVEITLGFRNAASPVERRFFACAEATLGRLARSGVVYHRNM